MVMYKNNLPLISQEDIGYELGLTVPAESAHLFQRVRTEKPASGLWGTQIGDEKYEINSVLAQLQFPLKVDIKHVDSIGSSEELLELLKQVEQTNGDALVCFKYGKLWGTDSTSGHVCVFDKVIEGRIILVDPGQETPKLREVEPKELYASMVAHASAVFPGLWIISSK